MRIYRIPKRRGGFRTIYAPSPQEKARLNVDLAALVAPTAEAQCIAAGNVAHAFRPGRSPVSNAWQHRGYEYTLSFDLKDFFDSVTPSLFAGLLFDDFPEIFANWFPDGAARQGLPTSPALANIAACKMDRASLDLQPTGRFCSHRFVYTRYADDLSFSYDDPRWTERLLFVIPRLVKRCGFRLNPEKTRLQCARAGRRIITGVAVDDQLHPTRAMRRRYRAASHQRNTAEARGLWQWIRLIIPRGYYTEFLAAQQRARQNTTNGGHAAHSPARVFLSSGGTQFTGTQPGRVLRLDI